MIIIKPIEFRQLALLFWRIIAKASLFLSLIEWKSRLKSPSLLSSFPPCDNCWPRLIYFLTGESLWSKISWGNASSLVLSSAPRFPFFTRSLAALKLWTIICGSSRAIVLNFPQCVSEKQKYDGQWQKCRLWIWSYGSQNESGEGDRLGEKRHELTNSCVHLRMRTLVQIAHAQQTSLEHTPWS